MTFKEATRLLLEALMEEFDTTDSPTRRAELDVQMEQLESWLLDLEEIGD